jgi:hypothetical protein
MRFLQLSIDFKRHSNHVMLEIATQFVVVATILAVVFALLRAGLTPPFQFVIQISGGELRVAKGKVPAEFLDNMREVCREYGIHAGWVGGVKRGKAIALKFSRHFPPPCRQRLRNIWFCP